MYTNFWIPLLNIYEIHQVLCSSNLVFYGCVVFQCIHYAKSLQSCPTLCDPIDGSPPGSPVPGILQARTLEWVAISFSNAWKWKVKVKSLSRVRLLATPWTVAYQAPPSMGFSRQEYRSGVPLPSPISMHNHTTNIYSISGLFLLCFYHSIINILVNPSGAHKHSFLLGIHIWEYHYWVTGYKFVQFYR